MPKRRRGKRRGPRPPAPSNTNSESEEDARSIHSESGSDDSESDDVPHPCRQRVGTPEHGHQEGSRNSPAQTDRGGSDRDQTASSESSAEEVLSGEGAEDEGVHDPPNVGDNSVGGSASEADEQGDGYADQSSDDDDDEEVEASEESDVEEELDSNEGSDNEASEEESASSEEDESEHSSDDGADEENENANANQPIYEGARITLFESCLAIFSLAVAEHLSGTLLSKILQLILLHCPANNICKGTLYTLKKFFSKLGARLLIFHYFCSTCGWHLRDKNNPCRKCHKKEEPCIFIEMPIIHQLQTLFLRPRFYQDLQYRFQPGRDPTKISDIYDGRLYREQMENNGFLSNPNNLSFMWWSDGLQIFKSSTSSSIWPICLVINELPYRKRILPRNIILAGIWFGRTAPNPNLVLKFLEKTMKKLSTDGTTLKLPDNSEILVKCKILCATCDLPAKAKFMRFKQSGRYSCAKCLIEGGTFRTVKGGNVTVFAYQENVPGRTSEHVEECAQQAVTQRAGGDKKATVFGVKGPSLLAGMVPHFIRAMAIDILHGAFLGVCKWLTHLWFDPKFARCPWSLHASLDIIDTRIRQMKPPSFVQRPLRNIKQALPHWKASEFKLFLLYYSVPVLLGVMTDDYFKHHCKLVSALCILCQDSISMDQIFTAKDLLNSYVSDFARLYHIRFLVMNFHQLIHLPDVVLDTGPLWVTACFFLESFNGVLAKLFHGTRHAATQICSSINLVMEMPLMVEKLPMNSVVKTFCQEVTFKRNKCRIMDTIADDIFVVGKYSNSQAFAENSKQYLQTLLGRNVTGVIRVFYRLKMKGLLFYSSEYSRSSGRKDSSYVSYTVNDTPCLGRIVRFVKWQDCTPQCARECEDCLSQYYFIVKQYSRELWYPHDNPEIRFPHLCKVKSSNDVKCLPLNQLMSLLFHIKVDQEEYIASPVNSVEPE